MFIFHTLTNNLYIRSTENYYKLGNEVVISGFQNNTCGISTFAFVPVLV
jgi:hypothetical protein